MFVYGGGDWLASSSPGKHRAWTRRGPGPDLAATHPPPLVQHPGLEGPRHRHPQRRQLGRLPPTRGPTGLSPIATVGRLGTVEAAMAATDENWVSPVTGEVRRDLYVSGSDRW